MYIKRLVLENFKSFGRRTELPFHDDFTTVSGPNGSGKSNIIDAILFGLGLARTRGIRARKLTDLIYNPGHEDDATNADRPTEAIVEVTLDNAEGTLSRGQIESAAGSTDIGDPGEIVVRRRVKRTDDNYYSYYYLNERSVNLGDIQDLLAQAGVTPEGYNVVMQGDVTGIINMTPYRRREIIDEIAGVAEFDEKRDAAREELDTVSERIEEAELRIGEKEERLDQLEAERETALEYQTLREERETYEAYKRAAKLEEKRQTLASTKDDIGSLRSELHDEQGSLDTYQGRIDRLRDELTELNAEIERTGEDEQLAVKREIEEIKGEIDRLNERIETATERIDAADGDRRQAFVRIDQTQERIEDLESDQRDAKIEKANLLAEIDEFEAQREALEREIAETDTEYESLRDELQERKASLEAARSDKHDAQREQDRLLDEARRRSEEVADLERSVEHAERESQRIDRDIADLERECERASQNREQIQSVIDDLQDERRSYQEQLESIEDELTAANQEYATLEARAGEDGDDSYGRSVTEILRADFAGVHGTVGQLGAVADDYATACETAAGGRLAHVVVDDDGVGARCIEHLKTRNAGRATFLPLTEIDHRSLPRLPDHEGVIDFAYELVDFDHDYRGIFSYVLGSTLVVDSMTTARELMGRYRLVTLDGDLVEQSGAMTGGSRSGSRYSFSKTGTSRLDRLAEEIASLEDDRRSLEEEIAGVSERLESARERRADAVEQHRELTAELSSKQRERSEIDSRIESLGDRIADKQAEREEVDAEMQALDAQLTAANNEIEQIEASIADIEAELADSNIPELSERIDEIATEISQRRSTVSELDGKLNELGLEVQYAESTIEELQDAIETAQNRKADEQEKIEGYKAAIERQEATLEERQATVAELEDELVELKAGRSDLEATIADAVDERDEQRGVVRGLEEQLDAARERAESLAAEIDELAADVDEYDPDDIPDHDTVASEISRLTEAMEALEPVNMLAIDEYDAVAEELDTMADRRSVLVDERDELLARIDSYETQKRETFMEAFDGINDEFEDIFGRLSAGTGTLHLENEDEPFEEGLTMQAQPADKPIQRLEAMSGGEKSLTALAFIFAIQRYNPAPFYALDEIDAFLDAVNAERVGELVDELSARAQFIVVSHRSALLERSERAIGVTMQENNVSAVTGIALGGSRGEVPADD